MKFDKIVGVIGGMGPDATVDFMARVLRHTEASIDQEHVRLLVEQNPHIPNRQLAMDASGAGSDPGPVLAEMATRLQTAGAHFLVMPCNLAHAWEGDIRAAIEVPFVSIIEEVVAVVSQRTGGDSAIGLLTTPGCFKAELYQRALRGAGHTLVLQSNREMRETMRWVEKIKAGDRSESVRTALQKLAEQLLQRGANSLIAACTEFPLLLDQALFDVPFISSTDVLALRTIALARNADY